MGYRPHPDVCVWESETHGLGVFAPAAISGDVAIEWC